MLKLALLPIKPRPELLRFAVKGKSASQPQPTHLCPNNNSKLSRFISF
jgi:hypothetical protein